MRRHQLFCSVLVAGAAIGVGCNRADTREHARDAAAEVRQTARRAGDQLSDSWLTTKIQAQYFADEDVKARHINVSTRSGVVTLTGFVDGPAQREEAVQIARNTDGVVRVEDRLAIAAAQQGESGAAATTGSAPDPAGGAAGVLDDAQVTARVQAKYFVDDLVKGRRIDVDTTAGVVTLSGHVASEQERAQALRLARETEGVQRVEDHLIVTAPAVTAAGQPPADDGTITTTIQAKYFVDTTVKTSGIEVSTKDGIVLLQGTVPDEAAREQAVAIARNTTGVVQVVDRLTIGAAPR